MWMPPVPTGTPTPPKLMFSFGTSCDGQLSTEKWGFAHFWPWNCAEANQPVDVRPDRVEGDVAEVEQARVADDDVQADGHHHEDHHVSAGARGHVRERRRRPGS